MTEQKKEIPTRLISVLREGISVIQMVLFKELRTLFAKKYPDLDVTSRAMLTGAIINKLFGTDNPQEKFQKFNTDNKGTIEQELLGLAEQFPKLRNNLSDGLRIQVLCDNIEGEHSEHILQQAEELKILIKDRELPLPSTFMTLVRRLGEQHGLTIAPVQITPDDDKAVIH